MCPASSANDGEAHNIRVAGDIAPNATPARGCSSWQLFSRRKRTPPVRVHLNPYAMFEWLLT